MIVMIIISMISFLASYSSIQTPNDEEMKKTEIYVFVAASLKNCMEEVAKIFQEENPEIKVIYNSDSSGTLQVQIEEGAECDLFFSASKNQMTALEEKGFVKKDSVKELLENKVVLIKAKGTTSQVTSFDNITRAKNIALAGEDVPVGAYAREIFVNLGISDDVMKVQRNECANVTAVLTAISERSNEVGIVYATDVLSVADLVEVIAVAPKEAMNSRVVYPVGLVVNEEASNEQDHAARKFIEFLGSKTAKDIFEGYGFIVP